MMNRSAFVGSSLRREAMTMTTIFLKRAFLFLKLLKRPAVFSALGALLAFFIGDALAERREKRAAEDRVSCGMAVEICVHAARAGRFAPASPLWRLTQNRASHSNTSEAIAKSMATFRL
jgi:uncharacterized PurR-regulated membrane protein YhhQ (DUF165 family)